MTSARLPRWPRRTASPPSSTTAGRRPVFQRPLSLGVDMVVHSASKYLGGHSDVVAGVVAGSKELIGRIRAEAYPYLGGKLSPFDAWLLIRGLRTLPIRMQAHQASGPRDRAGACRIIRSSRRSAIPASPTGCPPGLTGTSGLFSFIFRDGVDIRALRRPPEAVQARRLLGRPRKPDRAGRGRAAAEGPTQFRGGVRHPSAVRASPCRPRGNRGPVE